MKVRDICDIIESNAPLDTALNFDNVGLLIGDMNQEVIGAVIALDLTRKVIETAASIGASMIITHHPIIFNPLKRLVVGDYVSEMVMLAVRNGINVYACHTNADNAQEGLNYALIKALGVNTPKTLMADGSGAYGDIDIDTDELIKRVKTVVKGDIIVKPIENRKSLHKIALVTGSGGRDTEIFKRVEELGIDCYLTAEVAHNIRLQFNDRGIALIEFGHYESERIFVKIMSNWLAKASIKIETVLDADFIN